MAEDGDTAVERVDLVGTANLLLSRISPDLTPGSSIEGSNRAGLRGVHDAVDNQRRGFQDRFAGHRKRPCGLQLANVGRADLRQRGIVCALEVAPVHQPVVRFSAGIHEPIECDTAARQRGGARFRQVAVLQSTEICEQIVELAARELRRIVGRHERSVFDAQIRELQLVEQVKLSGRVHHLYRKRVFVAADAANFAAIAGGRDDHLR
jgi:hypothetical protein